MSHWRNVLTAGPLVLLFSMFSMLSMPAVASESPPRGTAVTVTFSVYLAPEQPAGGRPENRPTHASIANCDELLTSTAQPEQQTCQHAQTLYRWQDDGEHTLLTIMPI